MNNVLIPWLASLGLVTWKDFHDNKRAPFPSEYASSMVVFGLLSLFSGEGATAATIFAWGLVVAGAINIVPGIANTNPIGSTSAPAASSSSGASLGGPTTGPSTTVGKTSGGGIFAT